MDDLASLLPAHPFLAGLSTEYLALVQKCAALVNFTANQVIFQSGAPAHQFYLLRFGQVAVEIHRPRRGPKTLYTLGEGDVLGIVWTGQELERFFDARALQVTRAIALEIDCLKNLCDQHVDLGYELLRRLVGAQARMLKLLKLQLVDFYGS
jgi:CRP/FNR family transcriptional regulator, cyclic AMP receptor protein